MEMGIENFIQALRATISEIEKILLYLIGDGWSKASIEWQHSKEESALILCLRSVMTCRTPFLLTGQRYTGYNKKWRGQVMYGKFITGMCFGKCYPEIWISR